MNAHQAVGRTFSVTSAGRTIVWAEYGAPAGRPVVVMHGTPGTSGQVSWFHSDARRAGFRLICPDRSASSPPADTRGAHLFETRVDDYRQILDTIGLESAPIVGASGGFGYGLAAAAILPARVAGLIGLSAMVPGAPKSLYRGAMSNVSAMFFMANRVPWLTEIMVRRLARHPPTTDLRAAAKAGLPESDLRALGLPGLMNHLNIDGQIAIRRGPRAVVRELAAYSHALATPLAEIRVRTTLIHGTADRNVPFAVAHWLAQQIPGSELVPLQDEAHLTMFRDTGPLFEAIRDLSTDTT